MSDDDASDEDWFESALRDDDSDGPDDEDSSGAPFGDDSPSDEGETGGSDDGDRGSEDTPSGDGDDSPFGETAEDAFGSIGDDSPFGETAEDAFGGDTDVFDDEGFGGVGGDAAELDEADYDSDIERIDIGIEGLDDMILGGVPVRHLIVAIGGAGTGKTTFGLQFLHHGLQQGEKAVFIALEQSRDAILATANEWGWDFTQYEEQDTLVIVDLDPVEMANSLNNIRDELPQLIRDFGADRLVLDSVSLLEMMYDDQAKRRTEVFDFTRSLKDADVTTFLTSEASDSNPYASRHGIIEYLTDAVFVLKFVRGETQETRLAIEIQKIRNANHSRETKPYELTDQGLSVYQNANIF